MKCKILTALLAISLGLSLNLDAVAGASGEPESVTICHKPGTPAEKTLTLPSPAVEGHLGHGDQLGACGEVDPCSAPPEPPAFDPGTEPQEDEPEWISGSVATLEDGSEDGFNAVGSPISFRLSCPTLAIGEGTVIVYDNGAPLPFAALTLTDDSVTIPGGLASGRHQLDLLAQDVFGFTIAASATLWAGQFSVPVVVLDENGAPAADVTVVARLSDNPEVSATLLTDLAGSGVFTNLPNRSYNIRAEASGNRIATQPTSVFDGTVVLRLLTFQPASPIDNNDFSQGTAGWDVAGAPVAIVPHMEEAPLTAVPLAAPGPQGRTAGASEAFAAALRQPGGEQSLDPDFDLVLTTSGEGQQSISRTFVVEAGVKSVAVRYRFITSEVPGGYFGTEFNDFFNVSIRSLQAGDGITDGNSMNGLGLAAFTANGATDWFEAELQVDEAGDTVQFDIAVANVLDGLFDSQVVVDAVKKKKLTISALQLNDIDDAALQYLSASDHTYFGGNTRVHGTVTLLGAENDTVEALEVEVLEGGVIATGTLATALTGTLLQTFDATEEITLATSQLLFEIPGSQLNAANQSANGQLTLRVKARTTSGETAEKDFGPVTKLVRFTGANRYGGRDTNRGGDDWTKPGVRVLIAGAGNTWGDFSNMNGGSFTPDHQTHQTGNSADGWFAGYNARNAATAATIIGHLNTHGNRIRTVYVTYAPAGTFATAINGVMLTDGRAATAVIRSIGGHTTHFHWEVTDN